ncbi:MAG: aspartate aminotransferase family protein, partial [Planctomycetes bacterium]|nr:aspartate aminotransferase family protein [Planctomycetota bacterium]
DGIHLLGPRADTVIRSSPPMTMTENEASESLDLLYNIIDDVAAVLNAAPAKTAAN